MPPRISAASLRSLQIRNAPRSFCCAQCLAHHSIAQANLRHRISALRDIRTGRFASTSSPLRSGQDFASISPLITPATAINRRVDVVPSNEGLYAALENLKTAAANYVGVSRLALALRSLERRDGSVRIAVLAMDGDVERVKKLVRLLLADPLGKEDSWEKELADSEARESLLIRYGELGDVVQLSSPVRTLSIPSPTLQKHNLEILVSSLQLEVAPSEFGPASRAHDAILVPGFNAQSTSSGLPSHMTYPVHKTLLVGDGLKSLIEYGRFTANVSTQAMPGEMVRVVAEAPTLSGTQPSEQAAGDAVLLDLEAGEHALASIRQSIDNAVAWEHGWFKAGIPSLSAWLIAGTTAADDNLKPVIKQLVESLLKDVESSITSSENEAQLAVQVATVPDSTRQNILKATASWSEDAHNELRNQLDFAFASKNWARLKWYKLFWRSDDVTMLLTEIMEQRWLPEAEKGAIYLAGRIEGAGLVEPSLQSKLSNTPSTLSDQGSTTDSQEPLSSVSTPLSGERDQYHTCIPRARDLLASRTVPALQALSQNLVLQTGSATAITTALTAMAYIGFANATLFEAGAIFTFGVVISLKRLQNKWEAAREYWQGEVREEGRVTLKKTEDCIKTVIENGGIGAIDELGVQDRLKARAAVDTAREALSRMK